MAYDNYGNTSQNINFSSGHNQGELCGYYDSSGNYLGGLEYSFINNKPQYVRGASKVCLTNLNSQQNALVSLQSVATSFMCQDWCASKGGQCANSSGTVCNSTCCDSSGNCCNSGTKEYCTNSTCTSCTDPNGNCTACGSFFHLCNITNSDGTQVAIDNNTGNVTVSQGTCRTWDNGSSICTVYNTDGTVTRNQYVTGNFSLNVTITNQCGTCGTCIPGVGEVTCTAGTPVTQNVYQDASTIINYSSTSTGSTAPNTSLLGITGASEVIIIPYDYCSPVGDNAPTLPSICYPTYLPPSGVSIGCPTSFNSATASLRPLTGLEMGLCIDVPSISSSDDSCVTVPPSSTDPSTQTICTANAPPVTPPANCSANAPLPAPVSLVPNPLCNPKQYPYCPASTL